MTDYISNNKIIILSNIKNTNSYKCFDILYENLDIYYYYNILNRLEKYQIDNLLNYIKIKWINLKNLLNKKFSKNNKYHNLEFIFLDNLDNTFIKFINNNKILAIFIINCIHLCFS